MGLARLSDDHSNWRPPPCEGDVIATRPQAHLRRDEAGSLINLSKKYLCLVLPPSPMFQRRHTKWEILFYLSLLSILLWLVLKLTGVINTPALLEYGFPIVSALLAFLALYRDFLDRVSRIGRGLTKTITSVQYLEKKVDAVERDVEELKRKKY